MANTPGKKKRKYTRKNTEYWNSKKTAAPANNKPTPKKKDVGIGGFDDFVNGIESALGIKLTPTQIVRLATKLS